MSNGRSFRIPTLVSVLAAGILAGCEKQKTPNPASEPSSPSQPAPPTANPAFSRLKGKWQRTDGDYVLHIRNVLPGGRIDAAYLNPNPIHVSKAEASANGANPKVFVELNDVNYPGCTYALTYNPATDQLAGIYFQASMGQRFEVVFQRLP